MIDVKYANMFSIAQAVMSDGVVIINFRVNRGNGPDEVASIAMAIPNVAAMAEALQKAVNNAANQETVQ